MNFLFKRIDFDVVVVSLVLLALFFSVKFNVLFSLSSIIHFIWCSSPLVALYFLSRMLLNPAASSYLLCALAIALNVVNYKKNALTGMVLSSSDLFTTSSLPVVLKYVNSSVLFVSLFAAFVFIILVFKVSSKRKRVVFNCIGICALFMSLSPYYYSFWGDNVITNRYNHMLDNLGLRYISWDWGLNINTNGLYYHLIQTSVRKRPNVSTDIDRNEIVAFNSKTDDENRPRKIIFILCESCWYDESHFKDEFSYLNDLGFSSSRGLSPLYGGGTANAEFEILSGLPSYNSSLTGIIYQEYADLFRDEAESLARVLVRNGYLSVALHNNTGKFWRRDLVYKKFGFQDYISIENMVTLPAPIQKGRQPWQWQADDYVLYNSALDVIQKNRSKKIFMNIITMSTHGPYEYDHDYGENHYKTQLRESASRMRDFIKKAQEIDSDTLFFIYGDHKPGMNKFFYDNGVLNRNIFLKTGELDAEFLFKENVSPKNYGDVPIFVKYKNKKIIDDVLSSSKDMPFYCISKKINDAFIKLKILSYSEIERKGICNPPYGYDKNLSDELDRVYSKMFF